VAGSVNTEPDPVRYTTHCVNCGDLLTVEQSVNGDLWCSWCANGYEDDDDDDFEWEP